MFVAALIGIVLVLGPAIVNSLTTDETESPPAAQVAPAETPPPADLRAPTARPRAKFD